MFKLYQRVKKVGGKQSVFYDSGVGLGWDMKGKVLGRGLSENVRQCYREICKRHHEGDKVYLFGFSRGAAAMMSLANFLTLFGCIEVGDGDEKKIKEAWKIYQGPNKKKHADRFCRAHKTKACRIECLGVWDIVPALPEDQSFHNFDLPLGVHHGYHALALDEYDPMFAPFVWRVPNTRKNTLQKTVKQVWFIGVHSDIGGGYRDHALSDITLDWMIKNARRHGLKIAGSDFVKPSAIGRLHGRRSDEDCRSRLRWLRRLGKPVFHKSVLARHHHFRFLKDTKDRRYYNPLWLSRGYYRVET